MEKKMFQQGDVTGKYISHLPAGVKKVDKRPIQTGEGNHEHVLVGKGIEYFEDEKGVLYTANKTAVKLRHQMVGGGAATHDDILLDPGIIEWGGIKEWDLWAHEARRISD